MFAPSSALEEPIALEADAVQEDAQGRRFVVRTIDKRYATRIDAGHVLTSWGHRLELVGEDATHWHYRYYLLPDVREAPAAAPAREGSERAELPLAATLPQSAALRFERFGEGLPQRGQWRDGFDVADLDGDGELDLVHGPPRKGPRAPHVFLGDGRGRFRLWSEARFPDLPYDYGDARAADLDGDGALDLVLAAHLRGLLALRAEGAARFARAGEGLDFAEADPAPFSSRAIRVLDFDGDGRLDVLALGEGPRLHGPPAPGGARVLNDARGVVLYHGTGGGRFERRARGTGGSEIFGRKLALGDFDGDGRTDFAAASGQLGRRDLVHLAKPDGLWRPVAPDAMRERAYVPAVAAADFDRDGRSELALAWLALAEGAWWSGIDVLSPTADGRWRRLVLSAEEGRGGALALAAGDLDGDGAADLAAVDRLGATSVFRGDGRGGFTRERAPPPPFGPGCDGAHLAISDLDGDGRGDLVASFADERSAGQDAAECPSEGGIAAWRASSAPAQHVQPAPR